jgi:hypothetical protein
MKMAAKQGASVSDITTENSNIVYRGSKHEKGGTFAAKTKRRDVEKDGRHESAANPTARFGSISGDLESQGWKFDVSFG